MVKINGVSIFLDDIVNMLKEDNYVEDWCYTCRKRKQY